MTLWSRTLVVTALALAGMTEAQAQTELTGRVLDEAGAPIVGATVTLTSIRYSVRTDSLGRFRFAGTPGSTLSLFLQADGFREDTASVVLPRGRPMQRDFTLVSASSAIEAPPDKVLRLRVTTPDGEPVAYTNLQINGARRYVSDDSGRFNVPFAGEGRATLLFRRIGFEPTETTLDGLPDTVVRFQIKPVARTLEAQTVTARSPFVRLDLGGFYRRMAEVENGARVGYFMTPEDLALRRPTNITDAVQHFPSIRLAPIDDGLPGPDGMFHADGITGPRKFRIEDRNGCPMTVYLDRVRVQPSGTGGKTVDEEINSIIGVSTVAGIEVYPRAMGTPPEFPPVITTGMRSCGVVLIWTK